MLRSLTDNGIAHLYIRVRTSYVIVSKTCKQISKIRLYNSIPKPTMSYARLYIMHFEVSRDCMNH